MTDYNKATNFATKDALVTGDPLKVVKGTEIDDELNAIEDAIGTKANIASPTFTGIPKAPTAAAGTNTTQLATTAFVKSSVDNIDLTNSIGADDIIDNSVGADELNVDGDGVEGQFLVSDGDGSFSWTAISVLSPATSDPTTRDDGTALAEGDQYYNTTDDVTKTYDGSAWDIANNNIFGAGSLPVTKSTSGATFTEKLNLSTTGTTVYTVDEEGYYIAAANAYRPSRDCSVTLDSTRFLMYLTTTGDEDPFVPNSGIATPLTSSNIPENWNLLHGTEVATTGGNNDVGSDTTGTAWVLCYCEVGDTITLFTESASATPKRIVYKYDL